MTSTVGEVVDRCLNVWLLGTYSAQFNVLDQQADALQNEFVCRFPLGELTPGGLIALDDELMHVYERDDTNNRFLAVRGVRGTQASVHLAGSAIEINPRFPRRMVREVMVEELDGWPDTLYAVQQYESSIAANVGTLTVPANVGDFATRQVVRVRRASLSFVDDRIRRTAGYELEERSSGTQIVLDRVESMTTTFIVTVGCDFNTDPIEDFGDEADLLTDCGLTKGMLEVLELGAAWRLLTGRASVRLFPEAEGQARSAQEVGAHDIPILANSIMAMRERAVAREASRLYKRFGFGAG